MITVLKNINCYDPQNLGKRDFLIAGEKIERIVLPGTLPDCSLSDRVISCDGLSAFPGLIDQHVHLIGGGGEEGFQSHIPEIAVDEIIRAGITTVVGLLGADGYLKSLGYLYAKAKALDTEGLTTFLYSGCYQLPPVTLTDSILKDLLFIDKVIGAGEIALSDHRASQQGLPEMLRLASQVHLGGMLAGKAGVLHLHLGDGKEGLNLLKRILEQSDLPKEEFVPTHCNRSRRLFDQAVEYNRSGGNIDLTAGETAGLPVPEAVRELAEKGADLSKVTVSSDANGSVPGGGVTKIQALYDDLQHCMKESGLTPDVVIRFSTENVAKVLKLYPQKGTLQPGSDADILITDQDFRLRMLFSRGKKLVEDGRVLCPAGK